MNTQSNFRYLTENSGQATPKYGPMAIYAATILYGVLILLVDESFLDVVMTPMLGLWWLMGVAFFRRPREVAIIGLILFVCVLSSLMHESIGTIAVRSASFMISSTLAVLFATQKWRANDRFKQISKIIESVPANVIAADEQGTIIAASQMAVEQIGETYKPVCGHVFTDVFMHHCQPTTALKIYREWFQRSGRFECDVNFINGDDNLLKATAECSGTGDSRILVVMFQAVD
jgi:PAS domain-containing protein